jgi:proline dehydrogenase
MLRSLFIYLSKAAWARRLVTNWSFAWRTASRFVSGSTLPEAIAAVRALNAKGIYATLDNLGENTTTPEAARTATAEILSLIDAIQAAGVQANASVKLSQIGLTLDPALCAANLQEILNRAAAHGIFVRIDMEDSALVDRTLGVYRQMRQECGLSNTGVVIQSYLYRSAEDIRSLAPLGGKVRLCKGAYQEPADIAFPHKADVDANYDLLAEMLIEAALAAGAPEASPDGKVPPIPAIASHDPKRLAHAKQAAARHGLPKRAIEFQMLYGIRRDLQEQTAAEGYPVRVYVPYGAEWYPYFVRRLAERPANVWFFISNFFRK